MPQQTAQIDLHHDRIFRELLKAVPELSSYYGITEADGESFISTEISDYSETGIAERRDLLDKLLNEVNSLSGLHQTPEQMRTSEVILFYLNYVMNPGTTLVGMQGQDYLGYFYPFDHLAGVQIVLPELLVKFHAVFDTDTADAYLLRLKKIPPVLDDAITRAEILAKRSFLPPQTVLNRTCESVKSFLQTPYKEHPLFSAFQYKLKSVHECTPRQKDEYLGTVLTELEQAIYPAYGRLLDSLASHREIADESIGLSRYQEGDGCYEFLLGSHTTTSLSASDVHKLGKWELHGLHDRVQQAFAALNIKGDDMTALFGQVSDVSGGLSSEDTLEQAKQLVAEISPAMNDVFGLLPSADLEVIPVSPELGSEQFHHYSTPSPDRTRPGVFRFNPELPISSWELPALVYHETLPGHHLQMSLAQELEQLPSFRRFVPFTAYTEGWAKYAEKLPWDYNLVDNPVGLIGQLRYELISATNLVLDTGIHHYGWERERSVKFFSDNTELSQTYAEAMVDRISTYPGQACAYKIGMNKMLSLRTKMSKSLGERFDIKHFHNTVLSCGALPLPLLEQVVEEEIAATNQRKEEASV